MSRKIHDIVFPLMIYKSPGDQQGPDGTTYRYKTVDNDVDLDSHLAADWHLSIPEACEVKEPVPDPVPVNRLAIDLAALKASGAAPSRPELEKQAQDLGIDHTLGLSDGELEQLIGERLADQADVSDSPRGTAEDQARAKANEGHTEKPSKKKS